MTIVGWHASHEQLPGSCLLEMAQRAEAAGFDAAMCSDHLAPWSRSQGESSYAWSWLGAAMARTELPFGVVNAPGQRYHPAIIAQAAATLAEMFPDRLWVALGSGEALNELVTGEPWPDKATRDRRLLECVDVIRALLAGEEVTHHGLVTVDRAQLWTRPERPPALVGAAVTAATARTVGGWADGLITINQDVATLRAVLDAFVAGGGEGKPAYLQAHVSFDPDRDRAMQIAHEQWRTNVFAPPVCWDLPSVDHFEAAAAHVRPDDVARRVIVAASAEELLLRLGELVQLGFAGVWVHHVGKDQDRFIDAFAPEVLPALRAVTPS
jgi:probable non-F420 flavinoid oxidoreductase